eukprot:297690-Amphidinium_carterae.1
MVRNRYKMRHLLQSMCTWAWQRRPSSAHTPRNTGPGEARATTSPNVPLRNTLLLDFGMLGIRLLRKRTSLTSSDLPGCPASHQAENQPNPSALGVEHEPIVRTPRTFVAWISPAVVKGCDRVSLI